MSCEILSHATMKRALAALGVAYTLVRWMKHRRLPWPNIDADVPHYENHKYSTSSGELSLRRFGLSPERHWRRLFGAYGRVLPPYCILRDIADIMTIDNIQNMTLDKAAEGVRRMLYTLWRLQLHGPTPWNRSDCTRIATQISTEAGIKLAPSRMVEDSAGSSDKPEGLEPIAPRPMPWPLYALLMTQAIVARQLASLIGFHSTLITTVDGKFHVYDTITGIQSEQCPPILLLHGLFTTAQSMMLLGIVLAKRTGRRILIPDHLGFDFGYSRSCHNNETIEWHNQVDTTSRLVQKLVASSGQFTRVAVVGHSYGGWLASELASRNPKLLKEVILLSPAGHSRYRHISVLGLIGIRSWSMRYLVPSHNLLTRRLAMYIFYHLGRTPRMAKLSATCDVNKYLTPPGFPTESLIGTTSETAQGEHGAIAHPVLLLWPIDDTLHKPYFTPGTPEADAIAMRDYSLNKKSKGYWVCDSGHGLNIDALKTCCTEIEHFLPVENSPTFPVGSHGLLLRLAASLLEIALTSTRKQIKPMERNSVSKNSKAGGPLDTRL
eukprot:gb/GECG01004563.1/.p1 GENE.gb/GECG01004563.1/~~gb/GECG01004563.1/.p1  ORF type:complete len:550 (+),score=10.03 gb/GECG01004563.1/:1-1650(+)